MAEDMDAEAGRPRLIRWVVLWFVVFAALGAGITAMLRSDVRGDSLVFAALVWGAIGAAFAIAIRAGEQRPRSRRVRW
jgi:hypothetical protein